MGCDIHGHVEVRDTNGVWRKVADLDVERNYKVFAFLFGVRPLAEPFVALAPMRGIPSDVDSDIVKQAEAGCYEKGTWSPDFHSPSWIGWDELAGLHLRELTMSSSFGFGLPLFSEDWHQTFQRMAELAEGRAPSDVRLVVWFDN